MKKKLYLALSLVANVASFASEESIKVDKIDLSNGIDVLLCENFRSPVVFVGIIFHVKSTDEPSQKIGLRELFAVNFINKEMRAKLYEYGITYKMLVDGSSVEIIATMNPDRLEDFFSIIYETISSDIQITNLEVTKKEICLRERVSTIYKENALGNNVAAFANPNRVFNENAFKSISEDDIKKFFEDKIRTCYISAKLCGAVSCKKLVKIFQKSISKLTTRNVQPEHTKKKMSMVRDVLIENKYASNGIAHIYSVPPENKKLCAAFIKVFQSELYQYFSRINKAASCSVSLVSSPDDSLYSVFISPKSDRSIKQIENLYESFVHRMSHVEIKPNRLAEIAEIAKMEKTISSVDFSYIYQLLKKCKTKNEKTNINTSLDLENITPSDLNVFANIVFENLIAKIKTQFYLSR